ncbi:hypothetical protein [Gracilimonas halophila]|uniref:Oxygen tolerance n=1 Tax=Gracilimonas halophila TaxID=1834464 RepID=A0ABW5JKU7_9BACT
MKIILLKPNALQSLTILILLFFSVNIHAQTVRTNVNTDSISIGDTFRYSLIIQQDQEYQKIEFPDTTSFPPSVELIDRQQFKLSEFSDSLIYNLQYFGNEDLNLPGLPVTFYSEEDTLQLRTDPVLLFFKSVVAEGDTTLKPMKPNFAFSRPWWPWILAGSLLAAFLIWWYKFRKEPEKADNEPKIEIEPFYNPIEELEKSLHRINKESDLAETKNFKLFYSEMGDAIRTYFEELYKIPALESTSTELLRYLDAYGVDDTMAEKTRVVLRKADLVKFAKFTPTLEDAWKTFDHAIEFMERAKLADSTRISRLKAKYEEQFKPKPSEQKAED